VALVKPQFEVGKAEATRSRGVVRDDDVRSEAIALAIADVAAVGFVIKGHLDCVIEGPKGNREAFVYAAMASRGNDGPA
jgi:23S rRNA (cytidine1920-2'-O)/16S rRNA (cytidine1409-2'-O)-methyltransferase